MLWCDLGNRNLLEANTMAKSAGKYWMLLFLGLAASLLFVDFLKSWFLLTLKYTKLPNINKASYPLFWLILRVIPAVISRKVVTAIGSGSIVVVVWGLWSTEYAAWSLLRAEQELGGRLACLKDAWAGDGWWVVGWLIGVGVVSSICEYVGWLEHVSAYIVVVVIVAKNIIPLVWIAVSSIGENVVWIICISGVVVVLGKNIISIGILVNMVGCNGSVWFRFRTKDIIAWRRVLSGLLIVSVAT